MKKLIIVVVSIFLLGSVANSQEKTVFNTLRNLKLENESKEQTIHIEVSDEYNSLGLSITSHIREGKMTIEIFDPSGEKQGSLSIGCQVGGINNPTMREEVSGLFAKKVMSPKKGKWVVKIIPQNASANVRINVDQIQN